MPRMYPIVAGRVLRDSGKRTPLVLGFEKAREVILPAFLPQGISDVLPLFPPTGAFSDGNSADKHEN